MKIRAVLAGLALALLVTSVADAGQIGQSRKLKDSKGNLMKITLVHVKDGVHLANEFEQPDKGNRFVAVYVRVLNLSGATLNDCGTNDGALTSKGGAKFADAFGTLNPALACYRVLPHRQAEGWILYQVPLKAKPAYFDYTPDSGFADATADFKL